MFYNRMFVAFLAVFAVILMEITALGIGARDAKAGVAAVPPDIAVTEALSGTQGTYTVTIDSPPSFDWFLHMFAVENDPATGSITSRVGWTSEIVSETNWDAGFIGSHNDGLGQIELFDTSDLGSFDSVFGTDSSQAVLYWYEDSIGSALGPNETSSEFEFTTFVIASEFIALVSQSSTVDETFFLDVVTGEAIAAPEPISATLFGFGVLALGLLGRRRFNQAPGLQPSNRARGVTAANIRLKEHPA